MAKKYAVTVDSIFDILSEVENQAACIKELLSYTLASAEKDYITNSLCQLFCINKNIVNLIDRVVEAPDVSQEKDESEVEMVLEEATLNALEILMISRFYWASELKKLNYSLLAN